MKALLLSLGLLTSSIIQAQSSLPYYNYFNNPSDNVGWSQEVINGTGDWEWGSSAINHNFYRAYSYPNCWATNFDSLAYDSSERALVSPFFNFSDTSKLYRVMFRNKRQGSYNRDEFYFEYAVGKDTNWTIVMPASTNRVNWQGTAGFSYSTSSSFQLAASSLDNIGHHDSVRFRFRYFTKNYSGHGWMIDDFFIEEDIVNVSATRGDTIFSSINCLSGTLKTGLLLNNPFSKRLTIRMGTYWSTDKTIDSGDTLINQRTTFTSSSSDLSIDLNLPQNVVTGTYYVLYRYSILSGEEESSYSDNSSYAVVTIGGVEGLPAIEDFEHRNSAWYRTTNFGDTLKFWERGQGFRHHTEGVHMGNFAWHCNNAVNHEFDVGSEYLWTPNYDLTTDSQNLVINVWFKSEDVGCNIMAKANCSKYPSNIGFLTAPDDDEWDYKNINLSHLNHEKNVQFCFYFVDESRHRKDVIIDDFYVGEAHADLSIERNTDRFTTSQSDSIRLKYLLVNSGLKDANSFKISFYWSTSGEFDNSEVLLDEVSTSIGKDSKQWRSIALKKQDLSSDFNILYRIDSSDQIEEMREYNNAGKFYVHQYQLHQGEYRNTFEVHANEWRHNSTLGEDNWSYSIPQGSFEGWQFAQNKAWVTNSEPLDKMSRMHLYSPVFDLSSLGTPVLSFDMVKLNGSNTVAIDINMSYSIDNGATWTVLDTTSKSYNRWYYTMEYEHGRDYELYFPLSSLNLFALNESVFPGISFYNSRDVTRNYKYILDITDIDRSGTIQFRYNLVTRLDETYTEFDPTFVPEGAMIDNFSITEASTDLNIRWDNSYHFSNSVDSIGIATSIWNTGNYLTDSFNAKFYLSADTILSASDSLIGTKNIPPIKPDFSFYLNTELLLPPNLPSNGYILYVLDPEDSIKETDELNNSGNWPVNFYGISQFPYTEDFNDTTVYGWHSYSKHHFNTSVSKGIVRIRNQRVPAEFTNYFHYFESNTMFIDRYETWYGVEPTFYLETPTFDFSKDSNLVLSFDLFCKGAYGTYGDGGNFEYSLDNGKTWNLVTSDMTVTHNWYSNSILKGLFDEPGWNNAFDPNDERLGFVNTWLQLGFLYGEKNVRFRWKYLSGNPQILSTMRYGLQLDNFRISAEQPDLAILADSQMSVGAISDTFRVVLNTANIGRADAPSTSTKVYISLDKKLDPTDSLMHVISIQSLNASNHVLDSVMIKTIWDECLGEFFIFIMVDEDSMINEASEDNNGHWIKVSVLPAINYAVGKVIETEQVLFADDSLEIDYSLGVILNDTTLSSVTHFYWSDTTYIDSTAVFLGSDHIDALTVCDSLHRSFRFENPRPKLGLTHYVLYKVDANDAISEFNEEDNIGARKLIYDRIAHLKIPDKLRIDLFSDGKEIFLHSEKTLNDVFLSFYTIDGRLIDQHFEETVGADRTYSYSVELINQAIIVVLVKANEGAVVKRFLIYAKR